MKRVLLLAIAVVLCAPQLARADHTKVHALENAFLAVAQETKHPADGSGDRAGSTGTTRDIRAVAFCANDPSLTEIEPCRGARPCGDGGTVLSLFEYPPGYDPEEDVRQYLGSFCDEPGDLAPESPQLTLAMIAEAFRRVPLPPSTISIQPPGGRTLVNLPTILSTDAEQFVESVTLLGQWITLDITPTSYRWVHGDGTEQTTDWAGVEYARKRPRSDYLTHTYLRAEQGVPARVDTTWAARFSVNGGPWLPVPDTVTIEGEPVSLKVVEASPILVGYEG